MTSRVFATVEASPEDVARSLPGDDLVSRADVVMDRAFALPAPPARAPTSSSGCGSRR
jgi:hypothetical protein